MTFWLAVRMGAAEPEVLVVTDEMPAMEVLARRLQGEAGIGSRLVRQQEMPARLGDFRAVVVYIHGALGASAEEAFIRYATNGGRLVALHHSISSGKRTNAMWFEFLGVRLPRGDVEQGGYKWIEPADLTVVNLAPEHAVTREGVRWPDRVPWGRAGAGEVQREAFTLPESEVYLNHVLTGDRTVLLGLRHVDATGRVWEQATAGWCKPAGAGWVFYLMPGHRAEDFEHAVFGRMVIHAITWRAG